MENNKPKENELLECSVCLKEIPSSEAKSAEALDYVIHFCGLECYDKWMKESNKENKN